MPTLSLQITPAQPGLSLLPDAQLCYVLLTISASGTHSTPVNWALVADASRSMRIPIVSEAQFRELLRTGGAQEIIVDGVPVWQLANAVPAEVRAAAPSALDFVARALHSVVDRLGDADRFALVACAEEALVLTRSVAGTDRAALARGIGRLPGLNLGEQTDLAQGIALGLAELQRSRAAPGPQRAERLLLLTDGFTQRPEECLRLAAEAASAGVTISTIGLGGEFQDDVLTGIADQSGGRAVFLRKPEGIPSAISAELQAARAVAARSATLQLALANGATLRRITRLRPALTIMEGALVPGDASGSVMLRLGEIESSAPIALLLELMAPPRPAGRYPIAHATLAAEGLPAQSAEIAATYSAVPPQPPAAVLDAAARSNAARLQQRALATAGRDVPEAARLLRAAATRFDSLGEPGLAALARNQAAALESGRATGSLAAKELTYATRRLGES